MKHLSKNHQEIDRLGMIALIQQFPLATIISVKDNETIISHLPLVYCNGKLISHMDKLNPQAKLLKNNLSVDLTFSGPLQGIAHNKDKKLQKWNYAEIHLKGKVNEIENPIFLKWNLISTIDLLETNSGYTLNTNDEKLKSCIPYVKGFEVSITHWESKLKPSKSQNKEDFELEINNLKTKNQRNIDCFFNKIL